MKTLNFQFYKASFYLLIGLFSVLSVSAQSSDGYWEMVGYGFVVSIKGEEVEFYDINSMSCVVHDKMELQEVGTIIEIGTDNMTIQSGINQYKYTRLDALPDLCGENKSKHKDPLFNFDVMWHTFQENYCYFEERKVDWDAYYTKYRSQINAETSDVELYKVMNEMLESLGDSHITLDAPRKVVKAYQSKYPPSENAARSGDYLKIVDLSKSIAEQYCESPQSYNGGLVRWGMTNKDVAYVQLNMMELMADYNIRSTKGFLSFWLSYRRAAKKRDYQYKDEVAGAKKIIEKVLRETNASSYILDLRFNPGGYDGVALEFINHFTNSDAKIFSKKTRLGNGYTPETPIHFEPAAKPFTGDVYLLLSIQTASAAEIFSIASLAAPNFTRIGGRTNGVFSDMLEKKLPNGWEYSLSNEVYLTPDGSNYENLGVDVEYDLGYPQDGWDFYDLAKEQLSDGDQAIEKALELIASRKETNSTSN